MNKDIEINEHNKNNICKAFELYKYIEEDLEKLNISFTTISYERFLQYQFLEKLKGHIEVLPLPINDMCNHKICRMQLE